MTFDEAKRYFATLSDGRHWIGDGWMQLGAALTALAAEVEPLAAKPEATGEIHQLAVSVVQRWWESGCEPGYFPIGDRASISPRAALAEFISAALRIAERRALERAANNIESIIGVQANATVTETMRLAAKVVRDLIPPD